MGTTENGNFAWHGEIRALETYREDEKHPPSKRKTPITEVGVKATENCWLSRNVSPPWKVERFFPMCNVLHPEVEILRTDNFKIYIIEKTPVSLKGKITFDSNGLYYDMGAFSLDAENREYSTGYRSVIYDTSMQLTLELVVSD